MYVKILVFGSLVFFFFEINCSGFFSSFCFLSVGRVDVGESVKSHSNLSPKGWRRQGWGPNPCWAWSRFSWIFVGVILKGWPQSVGQQAGRGTAREQQNTGCPTEFNETSNFVSLPILVIDMKSPYLFLSVHDLAILHTIDEQRKGFQHHMSNCRLTTIGRTFTRMGLTALPSKRFFTQFRTTP